MQIDEPSSYLDVKQRLKAARVIRGLCADNDEVGTPAIAPAVATTPARAARSVAAGPTERLVGAVHCHAAPAHCASDST